MKSRIALLTLALAASSPAALFAADKPADPTPAPAAAARATRPLFVGVELIPVDAPTRALFKLPATGGLLVIGVAPGSPADGKLGQGDILLKLDDQILVNREQVRALLRTRKAGDPAVFSVSRGGRMESVSVVPAEIPESAWRHGVFLGDDSRNEELLRGLTERTRRMLGENGLSSGLLDKATGDVTVSIGDEEGISIVTSRTHVRPEGRVTVVKRSGKKTVTVKDPEGKVLVEGELTDELRAKLPEWAKAALDGKPEPEAKPAAKPAAPVARNTRTADGVA